MVRRGTSESAIQYPTCSNNIGFTPNMMSHMVRDMMVKRIYSKRSEYVLQAIHFFNNYSLHFVFKQLEELGKDANLVMEKIRQRSIYLMDMVGGYAAEGGAARYTAKVNCSFTPEFMDYLISLNQHIWRFNNVHCYIRVAVAFYLNESRKTYTLVNHEYREFFGADFIHSSYPDRAVSLEYDESDPENNQLNEEGASDVCTDSFIDEGDYSKDADDHN